MTKNKLWTRDFTIITIATSISMLGSSACGFAIGVMVLDFTDSVFLYALFSILYTVPMIICPIIVGPWLDTVSRKKAVYMIDFISAAMYTLLALLIYFDLFNFTILAVMAVVLGSIDSTYMVAYDSLYPNLVSEGNMSKAYSISSMIYPLVSMMVPVAAWVYGAAGILPIFIFNAVTSLIGAIFETRIRVVENHTSEIKKEKPVSRYFGDLKEGISYIRGEAGLVVITAYFFISTLTSSASGTLVLPFFKASFDNGVQLYTFVMGRVL